MILKHSHDLSLIILSIAIAIFASYTALDLANCISTSRGNIKWIWLICGSIAMGVGIWSMHFIGMLAFHVPGLTISYDVSLLVLSIVVAILASALALYIVTSQAPRTSSYLAGSLTMGVAIAGMHYIGIASMKMDAVIEWDYFYVALSIVIAIGASYVALLLAFKLREDLTLKGFVNRGLGGVLMGFAIAGMHYTAMAAMDLFPEVCVYGNQNDLLATDGLAAIVIVGTLVILGIALSGSNIDRALTKKTIMNDALQASLRARDEFLSIASHELRTPLTSVKLQNDFILRKVGLGADNSQIVSMLEKNGKNIIRINRLVEDMLDISSLSNGKLTLQKESFNLKDLIHEVVERLQLLLDESKCQLIFEREENVVGEWDRFRIEQVVTNLLTNAARYAPGKPIKLKIYSEGQTAFLSVRDEGPGIAIKDQDRIFSRFERVDAHGPIKGLGLGLFIVKEILHLHNGDIKIKSELHAGSEFIVSLPLS